MIASSDYAHSPRIGRGPVALAVLRGAGTAQARREGARRQRRVGQGRQRRIPRRIQRPSPGNPSADDLGGPPPKSPAGASAENKLSPLNPEANEFPDGGSPAPPVEYDKLLGDIATLRSRVSALTTTLFASKVRVVVETRGSDARVASFSVTLDDGVVFTAPERFIAEDERTVYEHSVAPGHHVLGVDIERFDTRNKEYRTWQSSRFSVVVPKVSSSMRT